MLLSILIACVLRADSLHAQQEASPSDFVIGSRTSGIHSAGEPASLTDSGASRAAKAVVPIPSNATVESMVAPASAVKPAAPTAASLARPATPPPKLDPLTGDIQGILTRAIDDLDPDRLPQLESARQDLREALDRADRYIGRGTANGEAWAKFLMLPAIREELAKESPSVVRFAEFEMNLRQNYPGLESDALVELREALQQMKWALRYGSDPDRTIQILEARMRALVKSLESPATESGAQRAEDIGRVANYLYESNQVPWAVQQLKQNFSSPNAVMYAHESLVNRLVSRAVAEPSPVDECILGTRVLGRACLRGTVNADLLPMHGGVSLSLNLSGYLQSQNRGYNRGVVLRTSGNSPVFASKQIFLTPDTVSSAPTSVATNLRTTIHAIEHRRRIVRRIASRKAAQQKPQADAIAQTRMQRKLKLQYDQQVEERLAEARGQLSELRAGGEGRPELVRFDIPRPAFALASSQEAVHADVVHAATAQLAASGPCRLAFPADSGVVVRIHQSLAINALESFLSDRTVRDSDVDELAKQLLGEVPPELLEEKDPDPWKITMVSYNPVQIEFDEDRVKLVLRFTSMEGRDQSITGGAIVTVVYRPSFSQGILRLQREGDIQIELPSERSQNRATVLRSAAKAKLEPVFKEEIVTEKIDLQKRFPRAPKLDVHSIELDDGWLQVGIR